MAEKRYEVHQHGQLWREAETLTQAEELAGYLVRRDGVKAMIRDRKSDKQREVLPQSGITPDPFPEVPAITEETPVVDPAITTLAGEGEVKDG